MTRHVSDQTPADAGVTTGWLVVHSGVGPASMVPVTLVRDGEGDWFVQPDGDSIPVTIYDDTDVDPDDDDDD